MLGLLYFVCVSLELHYMKADTSEHSSHMSQSTPLTGILPSVLAPSTYQERYQQASIRALFQSPFAGSTSYDYNDEFSIKGEIMTQANMPIDFSFPDPALRPLIDHTMQMALDHFGYNPRALHPMIDPPWPPFPTPRRSTPTTLNITDSDFLSPASRRLHPSMTATV